MREGYAWDMAASDAGCGKARADPGSLWEMPWCTFLMTNVWADHVQDGGMGVS